MDLIDGRLPLAQDIAQRLDRNVNSDLVSVLETVRHSFGRVVHPKRNTFDELCLDSFDQSLAGESYDAERWRLDRWLARFEVDRHPNLMRVLSGKTVEPKSREEADDSSGDKFGSYGQAVMFRHGRMGECINAPSGTHEQPLPVKAEQKLSGDTKRLNIASTDQGLTRRKAQNPLSGWAGWHVSFCR